MSCRNLPPAGGSPTRRILSGAAVLGAGLLAALVLAELALRAGGFSFRPYPRFFPDGVARGAEAGVFVPDRDLLWVSADYGPALRAARTSRPALLLLGDSCTAWGDWDARLAALVAREGGNLSFTSLAVGGWSTFQGLGALERDALPLAPEVVVFYFGWNDHWLRWGMEDEVAARLVRTGGPLAGLRTVQLLQKLRIALHARSRNPSLRVPPPAFRENLRAMVRLAREQGAVPVLVTAASAHEPGREPAFLVQEGYLESADRLVPLHREYVGIVREVARTEGAVLCDPEAAFPAPGPARDRLFRPDGIHLSDAGDEALATLLLTTLREEGLLSRVLN